MGLKGFVVAMRARIADLPPDRPFQRDHAADSDWLIVSRWGGDSEYLTISSTARATPIPMRSTTLVGGEAGAPEEQAQPPEGAAPAFLHPHRTWFGVLTPDQTSLDSVFLLNRSLPKDVPVAGRFTPAEGYVRLTTGADGTLQLVAVGREVIEAAGPQGGAEPPRTRDAEGPGPAGAATSRAWMVTAERRPWMGEAVDGACGASRQRRRG